MSPLSWPMLAEFGKIHIPRVLVRPVVLVKNVHDITRNLEGVTPILSDELFFDWSVFGHTSREKFSSSKMKKYAMIFVSYHRMRNV